MPESQQIFFGRQPILDREQLLFAYKLFFRDGLPATGNRADVTDPTQATATVIANAFTELASNNALGPYRCFIRIDHDLLFGDLIEALPPQLVALEILESIAPSAEVVARCQQLHERGLTLVIDGVIEFDEAYRPLLALADIIKVDIMKIDDEHLGRLVPQLKTFGKTLLAEKVESAERFARCQALNFDLFQGYYFARPTIIVGKKLNPSQVALTRLLGLVLEDAETSALENAFKLEPGLTVNMLRLTNSVSCGLATKITSLRHAITILGRRQLLRWLQLLLYSGSSSTAPTVNPLLQLAATRGRLMELLVDKTPEIKDGGRELIDQAFMVGILSLMPTLTSVSIEEVLSQLPVAAPVQEALVKRGGVLGHLLTLIESLENEDHAKAEAMLTYLPDIDAHYANNCLTRALTWANNLARDPGS